jgi:hypothetical protein
MKEAKMQRSLAVASRMICAALVICASLPADARLVRWTLDSVTFSTYFEFESFDDGGGLIPHPISSGDLNLTGWFIVDTDLHQITDWNVGGFARGNCAFTFPEFCTASWLDHAIIGAQTLTSAQSFEFHDLGCGHCGPPVLTLVPLTTLSKDEAGGRVQLASGALESFALTSAFGTEPLGGYLTGGSLIGTIVPEPMMSLYFVIVLAGLCGTRVASKYRRFL